MTGVGFSDYSQDILKTGASSAAFLSLLACLAVLACYWFIPRTRTTSFQIVTILIACNGGSSVALLVYLGNGNTIDSQSHGLCVTTAALLHFFDVAAFCWTFFVSMHIYVTLRYDSEKPRLFRVYHVVSWSVPTVGMLVCLGVGAFGNAGNWCWITAEHVALRFITYFLPFSLAVAGCVVLFWKTSSLLSSEALDTPRVVATAIRVRLALYISAFAFLQLFSVINRVQNAAYPHQPNFALYVANSVTSPLQGFVNTAVYGVNRMVVNQLKLWYEGCGCFALRLFAPLSEPSPLPSPHRTSAWSSPVRQFIHENDDDADSVYANVAAVVTGHVGRSTRPTAASSPRRALLNMKQHSWDEPTFFLLEGAEETKQTTAVENSTSNEGASEHVYASVEEGVVLSTSRLV